MLVNWLFAKSPYEWKYRLIINKGEETGLKYFHDPITYIEYSNDLNGIYTNFIDYKPI